MRLSLSLLLGGVVLAAPLLGAAQPAPTLTDALRQLLERHPAVSGARQRVDAARAEARAADRPLYNPELAAGFERAEVNTATVGVSQTIDWAGKREANATRGSAELVAAQAELDQLRQDVALEWLRALNRTIAARAALRLAERRLELAQRFAELAERRQAAGDLRQSDFNLAQLAVLQARVNTKSARAQLAVTEGALQVAAGGVAGLGTPPLGESPPPPAALTGRLDALPDAPPALREAQAQYQSARARVGVARKTRRPDPTLSLTGGREGQEGLAAVGVSIPLFVRNSFRDEVVAAAARADGEEFRLRSLRQQTQARLAARLAAYQAARTAQLDWLTPGPRLLDEQQRLLERLLGLGAISASDYLVQLTQTLDVQALGPELRQASWDAFLDWLETSGRLQGWLDGELHD